MPGYYCNLKVMGNAGENTSFGAFLLNLKKKICEKYLLLEGYSVPS